MITFISLFYFWYVEFPFILALFQETASFISQEELL